MSNKAIVHLRVYRSNGRDAQISYSADGTVQNENILVKLTHDTLEWKNYLKHLLVNGFVKVEVEKVLGITELNSIAQEVKDAMFPAKEEVLSPEQQKIADLEAKLDALVNNSKGKVAKKEVEKPKEKEVKVFEVADEPKTLAQVQVEYKKKTGKKPFHGWSKEQLIEKMK